MSETPKFDLTMKSKLQEDKQLTTIFEYLWQLFYESVKPLKRCWELLKKAPSGQRANIIIDRLCSSDKSPSIKYFFDILYERIPKYGILIMRLKKKYTGSDNPPYHFEVAREIREPDDEEYEEYEDYVRSNRASNENFLADCLPAMQTDKYLLAFLGDNWANCTGYFRTVKVSPMILSDTPANDRGILFLKILCSNNGPTLDEFFDGLLTCNPKSKQMIALFKQVYLNK